MVNKHGLGANGTWLSHHVRYPQLMAHKPDYEVVVMAHIARLHDDSESILTAAAFQRIQNASIST